MSRPPNLDDVNICWLRALKSIETMIKENSFWYPVSSKRLEILKDVDLLKSYLAIQMGVDGFVPQVTNYDCGIAVLAMFHRCSYEEAKKRINDHTKIEKNLGINFVTLAEVLNREDVNGYQTMELYPPIPVVDLYNTQDMILVVSPLNNMQIRKTISHFVLLRKGKLFDPRFGVGYPEELVGPPETQYAYIALFERTNRKRRLILSPSLPTKPRSLFF